MISSYDQPSKTEQIARSRTRRRRAARPIRICVPGGIWVYAFITYWPMAGKLPSFLRLTCRLSDQPFAVHQLCVQKSRAGGSANRVVAQHPELVIKDSAGADWAYNNRHSVTSIAIEPRLRALHMRFENHDGFRRRRQLQFVDRRDEVANRGFNVLARSVHPQFHRNRFEMSVSHVDAMRHCAHANR